MSKANEPELDGMPPALVERTIRYTFSRTAFVELEEIEEVGDRVTVKGSVTPYAEATSGLEFEIVREVHTRKDGNDLYVLNATEVE